MIIVFDPLVVTVGEPVVVPVYLAVGTEIITTPDPPAAPELGLPPPAPPPPPVLAVPATPAVAPCPPLPPPPEPPGAIGVPLGD